MSQTFSTKDPDEVIVLSFNLTSLLQIGETVSTCVFTATDRDTGDDATESLILGNADVSTAKVVKQQVQGGTDGHEYLIKAKFTTSSGRTLVASAFLPVKIGA